MLSTPHLLVGAAVGSVSPHPLIAFGAGFLSHFIMDKVPHWDWLPNTRKLLILAIGEFLVGAGLLFILTKNSQDPYLLWAGALGGVMPDVLVAPNYLLGRTIKFLEPLRSFHHQFQNGNDKFSISTRVFLQLLTIILTSWLLLRFT